MNWRLFQNSLLLATAATALAVALGFLAALWLATLPGRGRKALLVLAVVALALPPFLVTNCWINLLGQSGSWRRWLPLNIFSIGGAVWILALLYWPLTTLAVLAAWSRLEPAQLEVEPALRGSAFVRWLLIPLGRPALSLAAVLTFVLAFDNFSVPAILQTRVFPAEIWVRFNTAFDYAAVLQLSWPLVLAPLALWLVLRGRSWEWPQFAGAASPELLRRHMGGGWRRTACLVTLVLLGVSVGIPLAELAGARRSWTELPAAIAAGQGAIAHSLGYAVAAATIGLGLGCALSTRRIPAPAWLFFLLPGVLLGVALIWITNRPALDWFAGGSGVVLLALTLRYLAPVWTGTRAAVRTLDRDVLDAARLDGARGWRLWQHVRLPALAPQLAALWYIVYLLCLWDVESVILVMPPGGETLAIRIFNLLHYGHNAQVNALCLVLLALALLPLVAWTLARSRVALRHGCVLMACALACACLVGCSAKSTEGDAPVESRFFASVRVIGTRGVGPGQFNKPRSLAVDAQDNLYVVDMTGRVQKFSPDGAFLRQWQMPETDLGRPKGMCRDAGGRIVVIEPHYSRVNHFSTDGELLWQWGARGTNDGQFGQPRAAAVNSRGEIVVSEYGETERVQVFSAGGTNWLRTIGRAGTGPGEFNRPEGVGVDRQDRIYVADSCNHRVQVFDAAGRFLRAFGKAGAAAGEMSYPYDVQVDASGNVFVCEFGNSRVQVFGAEGRSLEIIGGAGAVPGRFSNPWAIALDSRGNLYVADALNHRVQKLLRRAPVGGAR